VTTVLANAVAMLARELSWQGTARQYGLNWKSVATIVKRAVQYGLRHRKRPPVHVIGIDEVSRRKGQVHLTVVYDLEQRGHRNRMENQSQWPRYVSAPLRPEVRPRLSPGRIFDGDRCSGARGLRAGNRPAISLCV
jgi:hypothetical protein